MQGQIFQKNDRNGYLAWSVLEEKGFMLTFVLRNAVSSISSLFSVLKTFQHIREVYAGIPTLIPLALQRHTEIHWLQ